MSALYAPGGLTHAWRFEATGCRWTVHTRSPLPAALRRRITTRIDAFEGTWSRFRPGSLVRRAATGRLAPEPDGAILLALPPGSTPLLDLYDRLHAATGGRIDPLAGADLVELGYDADYSFVVRDGAAHRLGAIHGRPTWAAWARHDGDRLLLRRPALVDVGAAGKGFLADLLAAWLRAADYEGVPVLVSDVKGDLTGLAEAGPASDRLTARTAATGQEWSGRAFPVELFRLGGSQPDAPASGTPVRTTVTEFGPVLLSRVLDLNDTQTSALQLVFHWADAQGLALLDLKDLRAVVDYLTGSQEGKEQLRTIGGVSAATAGVILRQVSALEAAGGDVFFGEPALDVHDLMRTTADGQGVISALELADVQSQGTLFSTFLMWLLAELFEVLPEVGDPDKPTMVFFLDEAHLLFSGASKTFLEAVVRTVRLIRSKGVGIVLVTQSPTDLPEEVLAQLGSRVQHALRAHTPADATRLKKAVSTFPTSPLDLTEVLTSLGTGQAVVSVLDDKGRPAPVAPVVVDAPASVMGPAQETTVSQVLASSPLQAAYATAVDNESAYEMLTARVEADAQAVQAAQAEEEARKAAQKEADQQRKEAERLARQAEKDTERRQKEAQRESERRRREVERTLGTVGRQITREITRSVLGTLRRR